MENRKYLFRDITNNARVQSDLIAELMGTGLAATIKNEIEGQNNTRGRGLIEAKESFQTQHIGKQKQALNSFKKPAKVQMVNRPNTTKGIHSDCPTCKCVGPCKVEKENCGSIVKGKGGFRAPIFNVRESNVPPSASMPSTSGTAKFNKPFGNDDCGGNKPFEFVNVHNYDNSNSSLSSTTSDDFSFSGAGERVIEDFAEDNIENDLENKNVSPSPTNAEQDNASILNAEKRDVGDVAVGGKKDFQPVEDNIDNGLEDNNLASTPTMAEENASNSDAQKTIHLAIEILDKNFSKDVNNILFKFIYFEGQMTFILNNNKKPTYLLFRACLCLRTMMIVHLHTMSIWKILQLSI